MSRRAYALLVLGALVVPLLIDGDRPWKALRREGIEARRAQLLAELDATAEATADTIRFHEQAIVVARDALDRHAETVAELERQHFGLSRQLRAAEGRWAEARRDGDPDAILEARIEVESYQQMRDQTRDEIDALQDDLRRAEAALADARRPVRELADELATIERGRRWRRIPILGSLIAPLEVHEIVPAGLTIGDGANRPRVERCTTCHVGTVSNTDWTSTGEPAEDSWRHALFGPHPLGDLVGTGSPHPFDTIGCTSCHGGDGLATDFGRAGHRPRDAEQTARWRRQWRWRDDQPLRRGTILAGELAQAGCVHCHGDSVWIANAPVQAAGRRAIAELGCAGCHHTGRSDLDDAPSAGPALDNLPIKTTRSTLRARLADPEDRIWTAWGHGGDDPDVPLRDPVLRDAVVAVLFAEPSIDLPTVDDGDPVAGGQHFERLGCRACHRLGQAPSLDRIESLRGPDLGRLGERASTAWVTAWLIDPKAWRPDTSMPDLRLDTSEAADLAAFLTAPEEATTAMIDPPSALEASDVDRRLLDVLRRSMSVEAAAAELDRLAPSERIAALGAATLSRSGCAGCHRLPAALDLTPPNGGSLATLGDTLSRRLEAGEIPSDWPHRAASRADAPAGALAFEAMTDDRSAVARAVLTQMLGWRSAAGSAATPDTAERDAGRVVMERHGCRACHAIGPGDESPSVAGPPSLDGAGARLRSDWLVDYLHDPATTTTRPWIDIPMPTFALAPEELDAITRSLASDAGVPVVIAQAEARGETDPAATATARAVGEAVYDMLQCGRCHFAGDDAGLTDQEPAPDYRQAHRRLRPDWIEALVLDPATTLARPDGGGMPRVFQLDADGQPDSSFVADALAAPMFAVQRARLQRLFASEEALEAYLDDPRQVATALRTHLRTLDAEP